MAAPKISILLVDDHHLVRRGFRRLLEDEADMVVAGEAGDGEQAVRLARELHPKIILMDCALPGLGGIAASRKILDARPEQMILMLSMHSEETLVRRALDAGARGFILKNAADLDLAAAIRRAVAGEIVLAPQLTRPSTLKGERAAGLTQRELEILELIVNGKSNKEIADYLGLSVNTVSVHRANIMETLGIHKAADLVVYAIRHGLVSIS
ncbi:MAG TPA: response regulator transcription factor [Candidatus Acidoferrales bacterium]|nr:response regulator transcription factor [Candidatus Acidoferrales bacterium]